MVTNTQRLVSVQLFAKDSRQVVRQVHGGEGGQGPGGGCGPRTSRVHPSDKVGILSRAQEFKVLLGGGGKARKIRFDFMPESAVFKG